jgi:predicted phage terminase large subunit-like protein
MTNSRRDLATGAASLAAGAITFDLGKTAWTDREADVELAAINAELCQLELKEFVQRAWPIVETDFDKPLVWNWHLDVMCQRLEQITYGEPGQRLIVNIPPGCMKSLLISVFWPCWEWASNPSLRYLTAAYSTDNTIRDNLNARAIITSDWYQRYYKVRLKDDQNVKMKFDTTAGGWRIASSVGGRATGEHPDRIIIDDPHKADDVHSDVKRSDVIRWNDRTISTRGAVRGASVVLVMQRLHEEDLAGHLIGMEGWDHICFPMRYETTREAEPNWRPDPRDPRTEAGELLWPQLFTEEILRPMEALLGPYGVAGQMQQRPAPEGGGLFHREWFEIVDAPPGQALRCRGWDTAGTEGSGDWTVGVKIAQAGPVFYIEDVVRVQSDAGGVERIIAQTAATDGKSCRIREEEEPGSSGKAVTQDRARLLVGYDYGGVRVTGNKVIRARPLRAQCQVGNVKLVRGAWNKAFLDELCSFPSGAHDDQVDGTSCSFNDLTSGPMPVRVVEAEWG